MCVLGDDTLMTLSGGYASGRANDPCCAASFRANDSSERRHRSTSFNFSLRQPVFRASRKANPRARYRHKRTGLLRPQRNGRTRTRTTTLIPRRRRSIRVKTRRSRLPVPSPALSQVQRLRGPGKDRVGRAAPMQTQRRRMRTDRQVTVMMMPRPRTTMIPSRLSSGHVIRPAPPPASKRRRSIS